VQRGDRVGLYMPNLPETFIAFFAALKLGAVVMPLFSGFGPQPIVARLNDGEAKACSRPTAPGAAARPAR
jgi:acetyl-CoA synthetase